MSLKTTKTKHAISMMARDKLRSMLAERMLASQAGKTTAQTTDSQTKKQKLNANTVDLAKKERRNKITLKCSIISCGESFSKMRQVIEHLNKVHHQNLEAQHLKFSTETEFSEWLHSIERSTLCGFLRGYVKKWSSGEHTYYYCQKSGRIRQIITEPRKRKLKAQGYSKINRTCPAHIIKHVASDGISAEYYATHLCYTDSHEQLCNMRLSNADRVWLAGKLALQIPPEAILREVRSRFDGKLTRLHLVTKQDLGNIYKGKYTKKLSELQERHAASITMLSISCELISGKEWCVRSISEETDNHTVRLANAECDCGIKCTDCAACVHRYSCTCSDNRTFFNMCKHIHYIAMFNVRVKSDSTNSEELAENFADLDSADNSQFNNGTTCEIHFDEDFETASPVQQLSRPILKLEEAKKRLQERLRETALFMNSLTTLEEMDVVDTALQSIKPTVLALRAKKAETMSTSLVPTADSCEEQCRKNVRKQRRLFSNKHREPTASSRPRVHVSSIEERKRVLQELLKTNVINNAIVDERTAATE